MMTAILGLLAASAGGAADGVWVPPGKTRTERAITFDVTLDQPPAEVFRLWTTEAGAQKFLAPGVRIDPRVGGLYQVTFDPRGDPNGERHGTHGARLLRLERDARLAFEWTFPPLGAETDTQPYPTWVEIDVSPSEAKPGATRLRFAHHGFRRGGAWDDAFRIFRDENWPKVLDRLIVYCRDGHAAWANDLKTAAGAQERFGRIVVKRAEVPAPLDAVWKAWTTEAGLTGFFAPKARVDARPGGAFEMYFGLDQPDGLKGSEGCRVLSVDAPRLLAFDWNAPPHLPNVRKLRTIVNVELSAASAGSTEVRLTELGWGDGKEWEDAHAYFEAAWGRVLEQLVQHFARATPASGGTR